MSDVNRTREFSPETLRAFDELRRALHSDEICISRCNPIEKMTPEELDAYVERSYGEIKSAEA